MSLTSTRAISPASRFLTGALAAASVLALSLAAAPAGLAQDAAHAAPGIVQLPTLAPLVKKVLPAVVNVSVEMKPGASDSDEDQDPDQDQDQNQDQDQGNQDQGPQAGPGPQQGLPQSPFDQFLRRFFHQGPNGMPMEPHAERMALGSGFIIDPSGYIVTNNHVVENADKVTVIFQDDSKLTAKVIGRDDKTDLALIKIDAPKPLPYVEWGDSNEMQVGDWVLAVGNPFGLGGTVSSGIISARGRDIHEGPYDDFLQIDASINRGNSGGPTFNLDGKVIGINTAIYSPNGGSVGIGFAIPSSLAKPVIEQLKEHGKVQRGWLGVQIQEVTPELAKSLGLPKAEGALVADVTSGGPAEKIGIKQGDVIMSFDGHEVAKLRDLPLAVAETPVGETAHVELWRDGKDITLAPVIAAMPEHPEQMAENDGGQSAMGLTLAPLTPERREQLHVGKDVKGVVVTGVAENSPLATLGIEQGDVIEQVNRHPVATPEEAAHQFDAVKRENGPEKSVLLLINRHGINQYVAMSVEENGGNG
jgi:serine protease Do